MSNWKIAYIASGLAVIAGIASWQFPNDLPLTEAQSWALLYYGAISLGCVFVAHFVFVNLHHAKRLKQIGIWGRYYIGFALVAGLGMTNYYLPNTLPITPALSWGMLKFGAIALLCTAIYHFFYSNMATMLRGANAAYCAARETDFTSTEFKTVLVMFLLPLCVFASFADLAQAIPFAFNFAVDWLERSTNLLAVMVVLIGVVACSFVYLIPPKHARLRKYLSYCTVAVLAVSFMMSLFYNRSNIENAAVQQESLRASIDRKRNIFEYDKTIADTLVDQERLTKDPKLNLVQHQADLRATDRLLDQQQRELRATKDEIFGKWYAIFSIGLAFVRTFVPYLLGLGCALLIASIIEDKKRQRLGDEVFEELTESGDPNLTESGAEPLSDNGSGCRVTDSASADGVPTLAQMLLAVREYHRKNPDAKISQKFVTDAVKEHCNGYTIGATDKKRELRDEYLKQLNGGLKLVGGKGA